MSTLSIPAWLRPAPDSMAEHMRRAGYRPKWQALNVLWSIWVFMTPLFTPVGPAFIWSLVVGYPIFLLLFTLVHVRPYSETGAFVSALTLLACISIPFNSAAWSYAVFACVYVPYYGSMRSSVLKMVFIQAILLGEVWWLGWPWYISALMVGICSSAGMGGLSGRISTIKNATERRSHEEVRRLAALAERERIGRDLHDLLGHTLSLITLKLELSRRLFDRDHAAAKRELEEAEQVARNALAEVRSAVTGIRSTDLAAELASARLMLESGGVNLIYDLPQQPVPQDTERVLAMVVREAVTNIARHARAAHAYVNVCVRDNIAQLSVRDDGRGGVDVHGNGLRGMRERVQTLGGTLHLESTRSKGTTVDVRIPLAVSPDADADVAPGEDHPPTGAVQANMPPARAGLAGYGT